MAILCTIFLLAGLWHSAVVADTLLKDNSPNCSCYLVDSGPDTTYFQNHRFYDFRYLANSSSDYTSVPSRVTQAEDKGNEKDNDQLYLNGTQFSEDWGIMNWGKPATSEFPVMMQNSPDNVYILQTNSSDLNATDDASTFLNLRTYRLPNFQSAAELENEQKNLKYASIRVRARILGDPGAVAGIFTFVDDNNESDIEILTDDPATTWRFTNQPSVDKKGNDVPSASQAPGNLPAWNEWRTHRIDWLNKKSRWFVDGLLSATNTYSVPRKSSGLVLNMWSDGGVWSGNMTEGAMAQMQIQWVQMVFNTSGPVGGPGSGRSKKSKRAVEGKTVEKRKSKGCQTVCKVDGVEQEGYPQVAWVSRGGAAGTGAAGIWVLVAVAGMVSVLVGW